MTVKHFVSHLRIRKVLEVARFVKPENGLGDFFIEAATFFVISQVSKPDGINFCNPARKERKENSLENVLLFCLFRNPKLLE